MGSHLESWSFDIDGDTSHTMRYLAPDGPDNVEVYLQTADGWQKVDTTVDGSYLKFTAPAGTTGLAAFRLPERQGAADRCLRRRCRGVDPGIGADPQKAQSPQGQESRQKGRGGSERIIYRL